MELGGTDPEEGTSPMRRRTLERTNLTCRICLQGILVTNSGLILTALVTFALFLRFWLKENAALFPIREFHFNCKDPDLSYPYSPRSDVLVPDLPYELLYILSLASPLALVFLGEMALWTFSSLRRDKRGEPCCRRCQTPLFMKRLVRFFANFSLGIFMTLILTDLIKIMTGMPRPYFLSICKVNETTCHLNGGWADSLLSCQPDNSWWYREARLSFPSLHASLSAYAAVFTAIYIHEALKGHGVYILRSFLCLGLGGVSLVSGLSRLAHHKSHGVDVAAGFSLGSAMAIYLAVFVLQRFGEDFGLDDEFGEEEEEDLLKADDILQDSDSGGAITNPRKTTTTSNSSSPDPKVFQLSSSPGLQKTAAGFPLASDAETEIVLKLESIGNNNNNNKRLDRDDPLGQEAAMPNGIGNDIYFPSSVGNGIIKTGKGRGRYRGPGPSRAFDGVLRSDNSALPSSCASDADAASAAAAAAAAAVAAVDSPIFSRYAVASDYAAMPQFPLLTQSAISTPVSDQLGNPVNALNPPHVFSINGGGGGVLHARTMETRPVVSSETALQLWVRQKPRPEVGGAKSPLEMEASTPSEETLTAEDESRLKF